MLTVLLTAVMGVCPWLAPLVALVKTIKVPVWVFLYSALIATGSVSMWIWEHHGDVRVLFVHVEGLGPKLAELKAADAAALKTAKARVAVVTAAQGGATTAVMATYTPQVAQIQTRFQTLIKEVPVYVTLKNDAGCVINVGAVRLLDDAVAGGLPGLPDAAPSADDAPSGVALSRLVATDLDNDEAAELNAAQLIALQAWVRGQAAAWATPTPAAWAPAPAQGEAK